MQNRVRLLAVILAVQLLLAGLLLSSGTDLRSDPDTGPLLSFDAAAVDGLTITDGEGREAALLHSDDAWRLADGERLPADTARVDALLERLAGLEPGLTVATSEGARRRFKVADDDFERRIRLRAGDEIVATLYLGTSEGVRRVHARNGTGDEIVTTALAPYEVSTEIDDWLDPTFLQVPEAEIAALEVNGLRLTRTAAAPASATSEATEEADAPDAEIGPEWSVTGLPDGAAPDPDAARRLVERIAELRVGGLLGTTERPAFGLDPPALALSLELRDGRVLEYRFGKLEDAEAGGDAYVLAVSSQREFFRIPTYSMRPVLDAAEPDALMIPAAGEDAASP
ncbi:MAG: DUF4340 domain-containing protein [Pseudomonadales bacterium]|jgi:hypothetical protein|nr:DUF4340 domain-containing protein [Pseudomonadales bacterium]